MAKSSAFGNSEAIGGYHVEEQELQTLVAENEIYEKQLTKRNEQYIFDLKKSLTAGNLSPELQAQALNQLLPEIVEGQKSGQTARQLFGTVTERTQKILEDPEPKRARTRNEIWLDNTLLMFSFLALMAGLLPLMSKKGQVTQQNGLLSLIIASIAGGYAFYLIYKYIYQYDQPDADKSKRPGMFKSMLIMMGIMLIWMFVFTLTVLIPPAINIVLDPFVYVVLAILVFGIRMYLKRKMNLQGSIFNK